MRNEFAEEVFREKGICLPWSYPKPDGHCHRLAVKNRSVKMIERAELIEFAACTRPTVV